MGSSAWLSLAAVLFGGLAVSLVTFFAGRDKTRAETRKIEAETARIEADTASLTTGKSQAPATQSPIPGWKLSGSRPEDYSIVLDRVVAHSGTASALLEAKFGARGFATLMQTVKAVSMRGKRIRMSAYVKTEGVRWAALWMRVDGPEDTMLSLDNMRDRPIKGTHSWQRYGVVLDVAGAALEVAFGVLLAEQGRVWVDDFEFEEVDDDVATTDLLKGVPALPEPINLDFEEVN